MVAAVAGASALAGALLGALSPAWQVALEPAQVLAGIVSYPPGNPFGLYELRLWTFWHQLLAPLLAAGVPERALTIAMSGVVGALSFAALALMALAHGAHPALAFATPFVLVLLEPALWGFSYPILLLGYGHTYGMAGLAWLVGICGLLGAGCRRAAAFLLGLAPAVHASLGACFALVVGACALADLRELRPQLRSIALSGGLGVLLAAASFAWQQLAVAAPHASDPAVATRYLDAFVRLWDAHRRPANLAAWNAFMVWCALLLAIALLRYAGERIPPENRLSLRVFLACGVFGMAISLLTRLVPASDLPSWLLIAMPTRLANLPALAFVPLLVGVLWRLRESPAARVLLLALALVAAFWRQAPWLRAYGMIVFSVAPLGILAERTRSRAALLLACVGLLAYYAVARLWIGTPLLEVDGAGLRIAAVVLFALALAPLGAAFGARLGAGFDRLLGVSFAGVVIAVGVPVAAGAPARLAELRDRTNDPALAAASRAGGFLAVGPGLAQLQLLTRRPLLLDPTALDMLPYAADGGPELERILREVYAIDFFDPPPAARNHAVLPELPVRSAWEARSLEAWGEIGARFGVSQVIAAPDWRLRLPELARSDRFALYRVDPAAGPPGSQ